jgi:hypothetical protein
VNERADIKESIRALLLKSLEESGSGPESPWHAVLSNGDFDLGVLIHGRKFSATGLVMYQLPLVVARESMTPELAETMATVKRNMTAGYKPGEGARYFTMWERDSIGRISLAVPAVPVCEVPAAANLKRKASESCEDRKGSKGSKATRGAGPFYLEDDEDYGAAAAAAAPLSTAAVRAGGREATVAEGE